MHRNVTSDAFMMKMFNMKNEVENSLQLFDQMKIENLQANNRIFSLVIDACSHLVDLSLCQSIISQMPRHLFSDCWIQNSLINMWRLSETIVSLSCSV